MNKKSIFCICRTKGFIHINQIHLFYYMRDCCCFFVKLLSYRSVHLTYLTYRGVKNHNFIVLKSVSPFNFIKMFHAARCPGCWCVYTFIIMISSCLATAVGVSAAALLCCLCCYPESTCLQISLCYGTALSFSPQSCPFCLASPLLSILKCPHLFCCLVLGWLILK